MGFYTKHTFTSRLLSTILIIISLFFHVLDNSSHCLNHGYDLKEILAGPKLLFIGNSTMVPIYKLFVNDNEPYTCSNIAVSGADANTQLSAWNNLSLDQKLSFDYILVDVGLNDLGGEWCIRKYKALIDKLSSEKSVHCKIICATMTPAKGGVNYNNWLALNAAIRGEGPSSIQGIDVVMTTNTTDLDQNGDGYLDDMYDSGDNVHPNDAGDLIMKENFLEVLIKLVEITDPTDPADPNDPTDPTDPNDPSNPTDPTDPIDPTDPNDPNDPNDPTEPTIPADPQILPPDAPSSLLVIGTSIINISITWQDNSDNEDSFLIMRSDAANQENIVNIEVNANDTLYIDNDIIEGNTYFYKIQAFNKAGSSAYSNSITIAAPTTAQSNRVKRGLIAWYNFTYNPDRVVYDVSGVGDPVNLFSVQPTTIIWDDEFFIGNGSLYSSQSAGKIIEALKDSREFTIECWLKPGEPQTFGKGRIISLSNGDQDMGFTIDQIYNTGTEEKSLSYVVRLSTSSTVISGYPELMQQKKNGTHISMHHICFTRNRDGNEFIYLDGMKSAEGIRPGSLEYWSDDFNLGIGNDKDRQFPWAGKIYMIAIYNHAFSLEEVSKNFNAGPIGDADKNELEFELSVSPNPVTNFAEIKIFPKKIPDIVVASAFLRLIDVYGNVLYNEELFDPGMEFSKTFDYSGLAAGIYFLQLLSGNQKNTIKIVKN